MSRGISCDAFFLTMPVIKSSALPLHALSVSNYKAFRLDVSDLTFAVKSISSQSCQGLFRKSANTVKRFLTKHPGTALFEDS